MAIGVTLALAFSRGLVLFPFFTDALAPTFLEAEMSNVAKVSFNFALRLLSLIGRYAKSGNNDRSGGGGAR